jgi:hypothetical protein
LHTLALASLPSAIFLPLGNAFSILSGTPYAAQGARYDHQTGREDLPGAQRRGRPLGSAEPQLIVMPKTKLKAMLKVEQDSEFLLEAPEVSIFLACVAAVNELRALAASYESSELTRIAFSRRSTCVVAELSELAGATERFDIVCPVLEFGKFSPFFWRWFNWWNDFLKDFSPRRVSHLVRLASQGTPAATACRPKEHWLWYRQTPAFALVIT